MGAKDKDIDLAHPPTSEQMQTSYEEHVYNKRLTAVLAGVAANPSLVELTFDAQAVYAIELMSAAGFHDPREASGPRST